MREASPLFAALLLCLVVEASVASADVVRLKTGGVLRGEIVKQDDKTITLRVPYGTVIIEKTHVESVEKEDALKMLTAEVDALLKSGKTDLAVEKLEDALQRNPLSASVTDKLVTACRLRAEALADEGKSLEADKAYRRILQLSPGDDDAAEHVRKADEIRNNASAAEKEAILLVSLGREREALEIFDGLAAFVPGSADRDRKYIARAHADYGRRLLGFERYEEARRRFNLALKIDPQLLGELKHEVAMTRLLLVVTEMNQKGKTFSQERWESLVAELKALVPLEENNPHLHYALGIAYLELGQNTDAALEFAHITGDKADPATAADRLPALKMLALEKCKEVHIMRDLFQSPFTSVRPGPPQILETAHFVIHHNNDDLALLVARGAEYYMEQDYRVFMDRMPDNPWTRKCDIYIYRTKEEYLAQSRQAPWSTAWASTHAIGGVLETHRIMTYQTSQDLLPSDLSHEITHIIQSAVANYGGAPPPWLREGTAVRQEPWFKRLRLARCIREAMEKGEMLKLEQILDQKGYPNADVVDLFYAQSYALVEALQQSGTKEQFGQLCRQVLDRPVLTAIQQVYGLDRDELISRWEKHEDDLISLLGKP